MGRVAIVQLELERQWADPIEAGLAQAGVEYVRISAAEHLRAEPAEIFVFLLTPGLLNSRLLESSLEVAHDSSARIVPVLCDDLDRDRIPAALSDLEWVIALDQKEQELVLDSIRAAVLVDPSWVRRREELQRHASEWEERDRNHSLLLRGEALHGADSWLAAPVPPGEMISWQLQDFISSSRRFAARRQRLLQVMVGLFLIGSIAVLLTAGVYRQRALEERRVARANELAVLSGTMVGQQPDLALLLGVEAHALHPSIETRSQLLRNLQATPSLRKVLHAHTAPVTAVRSDPEGSVFLTADPTGTLVLWDTATGDRLALRKSNAQGGNVSIGFSPDGRRVVVGGIGDELRILDATDLNLIAAVPFARAACVAFSPDGAKFAAGSADGRMALWTVSDPAAEVLEIAAHENIITGIAYDSRGRFVVSCSHDGTVAAWRYPDGELLWRHHNRDGYQIQDIDCHPEQALIACAIGNTIHILDSATGQTTDTVLSKTRQLIRDLEFNADGSILAAGGSLGTIDCWNLRNPSGPVAIFDLGESVRSVDLLPDGRTIINGCDDGRVYVRSLDGSSHIVRDVARHPMIMDFANAEQRGVMALAGADSFLSIWDLQADSLLVRLDGHSNFLNAVAISPDGRTLVSGSWDQSVSFWDLETMTLRASFPDAHSGWVMDLEFSPDGSHVISSSRDGQVRRWDIDRLEGPIESLGEYDDCIYGLAFSPDGNLLAAGTEVTKRVLLWDLTQSPPQELPGMTLAHEVVCVRFSPDGRKLLSGGAGRDLYIWDVETRTEQYSPLTRGGILVALALSPDGRYLAAAGDGGFVTLWDATTLHQIGDHFYGHSHYITSLRFSDDSRTLYSGSFDGTVKGWDVDFDSWVRISRECANRELTPAERTRYLGDF